MKKSDSRNFTICRLLTLLLIVLVGLGHAANKVNGASLGVNPLMGANMTFLEKVFSKENSVEETGTHIRKHLLYNLCSNRIVKIIRKGRKGVNARGKVTGKNMEFSKLIFESTPTGTIKIFGENTDLHICFNRKGKVVAKSSGKSALCHFKEEYSEGRTYTRYRSADPTKLLYLGFKKNGKPLKGMDFNIKREDCFKFYKLDHEPSRTWNKPACPGEPKGVDFCDLLNVVTSSGNKARHRKHQKVR